MWELIKKWADAEDLHREKFEGKQKNSDGNNKNQQGKRTDGGKPPYAESSKKRKPGDSVNVTKKEKSKSKFDKIMDKQCPFHPKDKHSACNCQGLHKLFQTPKKPDDKDGNEGADKDK
jgi:hypothetical protein